MGQINSTNFYNNYYGHTEKHLEFLLCVLKQNKNKIIYLAGDSSLDNKHWVLDQKDEPALNGYENVLEPKICKPDICYHLNKYLIKTEYTAVNTAIEEAILEYNLNNVNISDNFIINNIKTDDILVISIGANDIALKSSFITKLNLHTLYNSNTYKQLKNNPLKCKGMQYFIDLISDGIKKYIQKLTIKNKPKIIIISMIYYPDIKNTKSWCNDMLNLLNYDKDPKKLHIIISNIYQYAICKINFEKDQNLKDTQIKYFPMFEVLDGSKSADYVERVEPSNIGGDKISKKLVDLLEI